MKRLATIALVIMLAMTFACVTSQIQVTDPVRTSLYIVKEEWLAIRELTIWKYLNKQITEAEYMEYQAKDKEFTLIYETTKMLITTGDTDSSTFEDNMKRLRYMILEMKNKYGGNKQ